MVKSSKVKGALQKNTNTSEHEGKDAIEYCMNPWRGGCKSTNIALYLVYKGEKIPLCWKCWRKISESNINWGAH